MPFTTSASIPASIRAFYSLEIIRNASRISGLRSSQRDVRNFKPIQEAQSSSRNTVMYPEVENSQRA
jgi:hypothetical protein